MKQSYYSFLFILSKILLGCVLGCIILLLYVSKSQAIREELKKNMQQYCHEQLHCHWDGQVEKVDFLTLKLHFRNVSLLPEDDQENWSLYIEKFQISASLFNAIFYHHFTCHTYLEDAIVYEKKLSETSQFIKVMEKMFEGEFPEYITFDYMTIKQGQVILENAENDGNLSCNYNCQMSREKDGIHTKLYILDGFGVYKNQTIFEKLLGNCAFIYPYSHDLQDIYARVDCRLNIPKLQEKGACFLVGDIYATRGAFVLSNEDQSFIVEPLKIRLKRNSIPFTCALSLQADIVQKIFLNQVVDRDIQGNITFVLKGNLLQGFDGLHGKIEIDKVGYKNNILCDKATCLIEKDLQDYNITVSAQGDVFFQGKVVSSQDGYHCDIINKKSLEVLWNRYWSIPADQGNFLFSCTYDFSQVHGRYQALLESLKLHQKSNIEGTFTFEKEQIVSQGSFADLQYDCICDVYPEIHIKKFRCYKDQEVLIDFHEQEQTDEGIVGFVGFNFIKNLLSQDYKSSFSHLGKFDLQGNLSHGSYHAQVTTDNAYIRIPSLYNVLQKFHATMIFDFFNRSIVLDDMMANLYEGTMYSDHAVAFFDQQMQPSFLYVPLFLHNVLLSWNKSIFGMVSGRVCLQQQYQEQPVFEGNLIVDKAQLKGNIFSQEFQTQLLGMVGSSQDVDFDCSLDMMLETKEPVVVDTSFLQALVHLDIHVGGTYKQPEVEGSLDIVSGELKFPYKSLFITHGQISIMPKHSTEPMIEFEAKGKIKRYDITMRAYGTMTDQQIHFEASPYLTEEQIISLLLAGSQDSSLSVVMQAMFMQKLHEIVFGPAISKSKLDLIFNRLLQSFKNVRIFPQFTNQTGRGGVRGVVEVDATDRLHGRIDTNLMQLEDMIFEADYLVTDDVTIRAIKDGPSTYGGEVEMRWKFS